MCIHRSCSGLTLTRWRRVCWNLKKSPKITTSSGITSTAYLPKPKGYFDIYFNLFQYNSNCTSGNYFQQSLWAERFKQSTSTDLQNRFTLSHVFLSTKVCMWELSSNRLIWISTVNIKTTFHDRFSGRWWYLKDLLYPSSAPVMQMTKAQGFEAVLFISVNPQVQSQWQLQVIWGSDDSSFKIPSILQLHRCSFSFWPCTSYMGYCWDYLAREKNASPHIIYQVISWESMCKLNEDWSGATTCFSKLCSKTNQNTHTT